MDFYLPAEWEEQDAIQLIWPSLDSDWIDNMAEVIQCYKNIAKAISASQSLIIIHKTSNSPENLFYDSEKNNIVFIEGDYNDTWARDISPISVMDNNQPTLYNYQFNGWGEKFEYEKDNSLSANLDIFKSIIEKDFILEGGAIESNGKGTLLTTTNCLLNTNRNGKLSKKEIETQLVNDFNLNEIIWLKNGMIKGDDTDSHIDTLARFNNEKSIIYTKCYHKEDEHYGALTKMEKELEELKEFNLIPIPLPTAIYHDKRRLPATYANFLITNHSVLVPTYGVQTDQEALSIINQAFPNHKTIGIDCNALIQQNGSLHCITMQYLKGTLNLSVKNGENN